MFRYMSDQVAHSMTIPDLVSGYFRLADLMEANQEELAAIESLDSGAVYTLALKTHVGMSIQTFRFSSLRGSRDFSGTPFPIFTQEKRRH